MHVWSARTFIFILVLVISNKLQTRSLALRLELPAVVKLAANNRKSMQIPAV